MKNIKKKPTKQLEKFSTLFTQLGLVLVLFIVYLVIEHETEQKHLAIVEHEIPNRVIILHDEIPIFKRELKKEPQVETSQTTLIIDEPIEKGDNEVIETIINEPVEEIIEVNINDIVEIDEPEEIDSDDDIPFISIEEAPIFKGCEGLSKAENKKCFDKMMNKFVQRNFDTNLANDLGLRSGKHRIYTQFIIDKTGEVIDIKIRAPHPKLKSETLKTINKLPRFKPGKQNSRYVKVKYNLPITFKVD